MPLKVAQFWISNLFEKRCAEDTAEHKKDAKQIAAISPGESAIFFNYRKSLEDIAAYMEVDFLLVEGFKKEKAFSKIICLKDAHEARGKRPLG
jgi:molybdopterin-guanine dinucleotide biosynthesis protein